MPSTPAQHAGSQIDPQADPHDDIVAILRSDAAPRTARDLSDLHVGPADRVSPAAPLQPFEHALRARLNDNRAAQAPASKRRFGNRFARFLLAVCVGVAVTVGLQSYGEAAKEMLAAWAPQLISAVGGQTDEASAPEQPAPAALQTASADAASVPAAQPAPAAESTAAPGNPPQVDSPQAAPPQATPPQAAQAAPAQAAPSPDLAPLIEGMSREIASLRESIEKLEASQREMSRDLAKAAEKEPKRRAAAPPPPAPRPVAAPQRNPAPPPPQLSAERQMVVPPPTTTRLPPDPGYPYTPRPPLPLR